MVRDGLKLDGVYLFLGSFPGVFKIQVCFLLTHTISGLKYMIIREYLGMC